MQLVEQHIVRETSPSYGELSDALWRSKNLYNSTLFAIRQHFFQSGKYLPYNKAQRMFQDGHQPDYEALPRKVSQQTMRMVDRNFRSFFGVLKAKNSKPRIPKYLRKDGRFMLTYTSQAISMRRLKNEGIIAPSGLSISIRTRVTPEQLNQVRIIPRYDYIVIEVVYTVEGVPVKTDNGRYASVDLGVDNLATVASNVSGLQPIAIDGRYVKSANHYYNKMLSRYRSSLARRNGGQSTSRRIRRMTMRRNGRIRDYFHRASKYIVNHLAYNGINTLVIGKNDGWKQDTNLGRRNNQNFVQIPFSTLISMLSYKCALRGISVVLQEESYTSKCSFLDGEEIRRHEHYLGRRVRRGLFRSSDVRLINADVNGSLNILRKCKPKAFANGVQGVVVHPRVITP